jgi:hypothetical protein
MKLYIFHGPDTLNDYTDGVAFAIAKSKRQAIARIAAEHRKEHSYSTDRLIENLEAMTPDTKEVAGFEYGGG